MQTHRSELTPQGLIFRRRISTNPTGRLLLLQRLPIVRQKEHLPGRPKRTNGKRTAASSWEDLNIGIAEGGARTHDLEVDLFAVDKSHTLYRLSYPGKGHDLMIGVRVVSIKFVS